MRPPNEKRPAATTGRPSAIESGQDRPQITTEPRTQTDLVLKLLLENDEVESTEFYRRYIGRYSARIYDLRKAGFLITKRPCRRDDHRHWGTAWWYRLEALPYDPSAGRGADGE